MTIDEEVKAEVLNDTSSYEGFGTVQKDDDDDECAALPPAFCRYSSDFSRYERLRVTVTLPI